MSTAKNSTADALLDAHVSFILDQIGGAALQPLIEGELDEYPQDDQGHCAGLRRGS